MVSTDGELIAFAISKLIRVEGCLVDNRMAELRGDTPPWRGEIIDAIADEIEAKISEQRPEDELKALRRSLIAAADYLAESGYPKENWGQFCAVHLEPHLTEAKIKQLNTTYRKARLGHE